MGTLPSRDMGLVGPKAWMLSNNKSLAGRGEGVPRFGLGACFVLLTLMFLSCLALEWRELLWIGESFGPSFASVWHAAHKTEFGVLGVPHCRSSNGSGVNVKWTREDLINALQEFVPIYENRPIKNNVYGMGFDHSFGLWFMARELKPVLMIESGAFKGHSTWIMRQAQPEARIISISPRHPEKYLKKGPAYVDHNCRYFSGKDFVDFGNIEWSKILAQTGIDDPSKVLIFFDDHQNELKRVKQAKAAGFKHLIFEDNYDTGTGDHYSLRQICDQFGLEGGGHRCVKNSTEAMLRKGRKNLWRKAVEMEELCGEEGEWWGVRGEMRDNFNHSNVRIAREEHEQNWMLLESMLDTYWELPPIADPALTLQTRFDPARTKEPIVHRTERALFRALGLHSMDKSVFDGYTQMAYIQLKGS